MPKFTAGPTKPQRKVYWRSEKQETWCTNYLGIYKFRWKAMIWDCDRYNEDAG